MLISTSNYLRDKQKKDENGYRRDWHFNPLSAGLEYIRFFFFLLPHQVPHFKHVKDKI